MGNVEKKRKKPGHLSSSRSFLLGPGKVCQVDGNIPIWPADLGLERSVLCILKFLSQTPDMSEKNTECSHKLDT